MAGIYGIRTAGLAVAVGTWSSINVLSSFFWGIFVFEERVKSIPGTCGAVTTLIIGLLGMSFFSRPSTNKNDVEMGKKEKVDGGEADATDDDGIRKRLSPTNEMKSSKNKRASIKKLSKDRNKVKEKPPRSGNSKAPSSLGLTPLEVESLLTPKLSGDIDTEKNTISLFDGQITLTKQQVGILAALFNGGWGGTNLVPLHFASREGFGGPGYVVSFACGSMLVTIALWLFRYMFELYRLDGAVVKAFHALPSFYIRQMWVQGALSGFLYSLGNFMSIIAVTQLGQGVGYSFTQASMLVSGLWGIFKFGEIKGSSMILKWVGSACVAVTGILWLSYEHAS